MSPDELKTLDVRTRAKWRAWLAKNHDSSPGVWFVFHKKHTGVPCVSYDEAVEEAICFGWIDSLVRRLDDDRYVQKFTPRKANSNWSTVNRRRYRAMKKQGLLTQAGLDRAPTGRSGDAPRPSATKPPAYIEKALKKNKKAWGFFEQLAPSYRRAYIGWIDSAKRDETRERRIREAVRLLAAGKRLGMK